jgi:hypothetical protein
MNKTLGPIIQRMMCITIFVLSLPFLVSGQQQERIVDWHPVRNVSAAKVLEIVDIKIAGKSITIGQPFTANEDWLDTLTFRIRNISGKTIKLLGFGVAFPEINANGHTPGFSVVYGVDAAQRDSSLRKFMVADEEVDLKLPEDQLAIMRQVSLNTGGTSSLSKINILPGLVTFEDGSRSGGISLRREVSEKP